MYFFLINNFLDKIQKYSQNKYEKSEIKKILKQAFSNFKTFKDIQLDKLPDWLSEKELGYQSFDCQNPFFLMNSENVTYTRLSQYQTSFSPCINKYGTVIPISNKYGIEFWIEENGNLYFSNQLDIIEQNYSPCSNALELKLACNKHLIFLKYSLKEVDKKQMLIIDFKYKANVETSPQLKLHIAMRPYNFQTFYPLYSIHFSQKNVMYANHNPALYFSEKPSNVICFNTKLENIFKALSTFQHIYSVKNSKGTCTGIATYNLKENFYLQTKCSLKTYIPLGKISYKILNKSLNKLSTLIENTTKQEPRAYKTPPQNKVFIQTNNESDNFLIESSLCQLYQHRNFIPNYFFSNKNLPYYYNLIIFASSSITNFQLQESYLNLFYKSLLDSKQWGIESNNTVLYFLSSLIEISKNHPQYNIAIQYKKIIKKYLNRIISNTDYLIQIAGSYTYTDSRTIFSIEKLESLLINTYLIDQFKQNRLFKEYLSKSVKEKLNSINLVSLIERLDWDFIAKKYNSSIFSNFYSSPLIFAACFLDLFDNKRIIFIHQLYRNFLKNDSFLLNKIPLGGYSAIFHFQFLLLSQKAFGIHSYSRTLLSKSIYCHHWPTLISPKTFEGSFGLGQDITANALYLKLICNQYVEENKEEINLFKCLELNGTEKGLIVQIENLKLLTGLFSCILSKANQDFQLKIKLISKQPKKIHCHFPLKIKHLSKDTLHILTATQHFQIQATQEWQTFMINCENEKSPQTAQNR